MNDKTSPLIRTTHSADRIRESAAIDRSKRANEELQQAKAQQQRVRTTHAEERAILLEQELLRVRNEDYTDPAQANDFSQRLPGTFPSPTSSLSTTAYIREQLAVEEAQQEELQRQIEEVNQQRPVLRRARGDIVQDDLNAQNTGDVKKNTGAEIRLPVRWPIESSRHDLVLVYRLLYLIPARELS